MSIYDVNFYARKKDGEMKLCSVANGEVPSPGYYYTATLIREFAGKKDVVIIKSDVDQPIYTMLYENYTFYDYQWKEDYTWNETKEQLIILKEQSIKSILDCTFYGVASSICLESRKMQVELRKSKLFLSDKLNHEMFEAKVLKQYKGEEYVVKVESEKGYTEYVKLFEPQMVYNDEVEAWKCLYEGSEIPLKIMECYIKTKENAVGEQK